MDIKRLIHEVLQCMGGKYDSIEAARMLIAIGYQESNFEHRKQIGGPAVGFWQFEKGGGIAGVWRHHSTKDLARRLFEEHSLRGDHPINTLYLAFQQEEYDVLAGCYARLLLWSSPKALPIDKEEAWEYYLDTWRPGKPHRNRWDANWQKALDLTQDWV